VVYVVAEEREIVLMRLGDDRHLGYGDPDVMIGTRVGPFTIVRLVFPPSRRVVPAGQYLVRLANDDVGQDEATTITVAPDRTATIERSW
jgi:hypothetical protein